MKTEYLRDGLDNCVVHAIQECAELIKSITKCRLFGWGNHYPQRNELNYEAVIREMEDVQTALFRLRTAMVDDEKRMGEIK